MDVFSAQRAALRFKIKKKKKLAIDMEISLLQMCPGKKSIHVKQKQQD